MKTIFFVAVVFAAGIISVNAQGLGADLVIVNANVHTMNAAQKEARSIAVVGNKIVAIGSDDDTKSLIGPKTRVIDAKGRLLIPGFNDAHVHFLETGSQLSSVDLRHAKSPEEFVRLIKEFAARQPKADGLWHRPGTRECRSPHAPAPDARHRHQTGLRRRSMRQRAGFVRAPGTSLL